MNPYDVYADNGYQRTFNNHGLKSLARGVNVPDADLGIGDAEVTASVPLLVTYAPIVKMPETAPVASVDDTFIKTQGGGLDVKSFPQSGYFGDSIGGF